MRTTLSAAALALALLLGGPALAAVPPEGVEPRIRRGFFTETDIGVFWTLGGEDNYSNAQSYLQLGVGYDLTERFAVGVHFGLGSSAANCFAGFVPGTDTCRLTSNFTVAFGDATLAYNIRLAERFYLAPKLAAGLTRLDPRPVDDDGGVEGATQPARGMTALNAGAGVGIEYATLFDHFSVGADVLVRYIIGPDIPTFALFPRVKYTF